MINKIKVPSDEDEARIVAAAESDPDARPWTEEELSQVKVAQLRRGRPKVATPKEHVTIRLDADILQALRASGKGWQTRVNDALRDYVAEL
uniref:BrnA antitoxin family protein n=1 Tax=uncultured Thiotrichaceae bacterium TaxID=298394 RepID=A0A6S6UJ02_9GAMM|nr:MAG: Unknown protein [uncultured Thiotrichaceae bacterium]